MAATKPGSQPGARPSTRPGSWPGPQSGSQGSQGSRPSSAGRSQTGSQPGAPTVGDEVKAVPTGNEVLGRYQLLTELASGGMATLYLARASGPAGFEKLVAIKRIHPHLSHERVFLEMFLDEARIAARIHHPNVVQIYDLGESDQSFYIAMEYIEGESLARLAGTVWQQQQASGQKIGLPLAEAGFMVAEAAAGLHAAHELRGPDNESLNLVHRDISPHNILVTYDGFVKLVDFGVAKARGRLTSTTDRSLKGKIAYMSPEQILGKEVDRRSDLFSLGIVLYEMTTARRLFKQPNEAATINQILQGKIPLPHTLYAGFPPALEQIVMRALQLDPAKRFQSADEMRRAIQQLLPALGAPISASEISALMQRTFTDRIELKVKLRTTGGSAPPSADEVFEELGTSNTLEFKALKSSRVFSRLGLIGWLRYRLLRQRALAGALATALLALVGLGIYLGTRPQPEPMAAVETGSLRILSDPAGAEVWVDGGGPRGETPLTLLDIALGSHVVTVRQPGIGTWEKTLTLTQPDQQILVDAVLQRAPTSALPAAQSQPQVASADQTSPPTNPVKARPHKRRPRVKEKEVAVDSSETGLMTLKTIPWAEVWLKGERLGQTPLVGKKLPRGQHTLELRPEGRTPGVPYKITIKTGEHVRKEVNLR
ncbi:MAG: serine/threonine protein kinase [Deltaproteobacteria bacterium]|nr:serine/threonine protein kinase [Deltaproteobacteria bacterium]